MRIKVPTFGGVDSAPSEGPVENAGAEFPTVTMGVGFEPSEQMEGWPKHP